MKSNPDYFNRLAGLSKNRLKRTTEPKWWLERALGTPIASIALDPGPHLFTDWRYISPGQLSWLSQEGEPYKLGEPDDLGPIDAVSGRHPNGYGGPQDAPGGIRIAAEPAQRSGLIENDRDLPGQTIVRDEGIYRTWAGDRYGESADGFAWSNSRKLTFDWTGCEVQWEPTIHANVFIDPSAPDTERFKTMIRANIGAVRGGEEYFKKTMEDFLVNRPEEIDPKAVNPWNFTIYFGAVTPDGVNWKVLPGQLMMQVSDTLNVFTFDRVLNRYVMYGRCWWYYGRRCIFRAETTDFRNWPTPEMLIWPEISDHPSEDWYTNSKSLYPGTIDHHFMFPALYHRASDSTELHLFSSPDGVTWSRLPGGPVLRSGPTGAGDGGCVFGGTELLPLGGSQVGLIFTDYPYPHKYPRNRHTMQVDRAYALWDRDRLASVQAEDMGFFCSQPHIVPGRSLHLNAATHKSGWVRIEVTDVHGRAIEGRSFEDCDPVVGNHSDAEVRWNGVADLGHRDGEPIILRYRMKHTKLFAFDIR